MEEGERGGRRRGKEGVGRVEANVGVENICYFGLLFFVVF